MDVNEAEAKHRAYLWSLNGVVAVGIGYDEFSERPTIDVYVRHRLPEHSGVAKTLEGYKEIVDLPWIVAIREARVPDRQGSDR
jgi:hypothetical protein